MDECHNKMLHQTVTDRQFAMLALSQIVKKMG